MRNRYVKPCSICGGSVPAGEGDVLKNQSGWEVLHASPCARTSVAEGHGRAYVYRVLRILNHPDASRDDVLYAVHGFLSLVRLGWTRMETCQRLLLNSPALSCYDRLEVEELLAQLRLNEETHA